MGVAVLEPLHERRRTCASLQAAARDGIGGGKLEGSRRAADEPNVQRWTAQRRRGERGRGPVPGLKGSKAVLVRGVR